VFGFLRSAQKNRTPTKERTAAPERRRGAAEGKKADRVGPFFNAPNEQFVMIS